MKTNKTFKKLASVAAAAVIASCAAVPMTSFNVEAGNATITINNTINGYEYGAYEVFTGTYDVTSRKLSDIQWGANIDGDKALQLFKQKGSLTEGKLFSDCTTAADVADKLANYQNNSEVAQYFAKIMGMSLNSQNAVSLSTKNTDADGKVMSYTLSVPGNAYYLIKNTSVDTSISDLAYTQYIVDVIDKDATIEVKSDIPTLKKQVKDTNDSSTETVTEYGAVADYDVGDIVPFKLEATIDKDFKLYTENVVYEFYEELLTGFEFGEVTDVVVLKTDNSETSIKSNSFVTVNTNYIPGSPVVTISNIKSLSGITADDKIVVYYTAKLKDEAEASKCNENRAYLKYTNNPYGIEMGRTNMDQAFVHTYDITINKVKEDTDASNGYSALDGAGFTLYKYNASSPETDKAKKFERVEEIKNADAADVFTFHGVDDGWYKLVESETPTGYNTMDDIYFKIVPNHSNSTNNTDLKVIITDKDENEISNPTVTLTGDATTGVISGNIVNKQGAILPSTGGIGTTPFFVGGGVLVVGAGVYLIVRKRMKNNDK